MSSVPHEIAAHEGAVPVPFRHKLLQQHQQDFVTTRRCACSDLPDCLRTMTGSDDDAPAARGPPLATCDRRPDGRESSRACRPADFPAVSSFTGCTVRCHEDVPRHIYGLFQALGIQYRWVLTRGPLGRELLKAEDLVIDDVKEESWMAVYEHERYLLEDTVLCDHTPCLGWPIVRQGATLAAAAASPPQIQRVMRFYY
jgi:hypothetical protein